MYHRILVPPDGSAAAERGLSHLLLGSDAEPVLRSAPVPVLPRQPRP